jgi:hypothetical protein
LSHGGNQDLAAENNELHSLVEYQQLFLASTATKYADLTKHSFENAITFTKDKVALLKRAEAAEAQLTALLK